MKVTYDPEVDVLRILFRDAPIEESDEDKPGVILDYDKDGNVVGLEVLNASQRIENPRALGPRLLPARSVHVLSQSEIGRAGSKSLTVSSPRTNWTTLCSQVGNK